MDSTLVIRKMLSDCLGEGAPLLVDLKKVRHIEGSGVASPVEAYHCALCNGVGFYLAAPSRKAVLVLELSRLH
jgi:anti-anti-sigma regulatory factor